LFEPLAPRSEVNTGVVTANCLLQTANCFLAEACGNRTHPGRLSTTRNGFEARENHQAPCASRRESK